MCGGAYLSCSCSCLANPAWLWLWGSLLRALPSLDSPWWLLVRWVEASLSRDSKLQPQRGKSMFLAEQGVSFVLHAPFVIPQILYFLLMSLRNELSSSHKPQLTTPCALGVCAAGQSHCAQERVTLLPSLGFPTSRRST